MSGSIEFAQSLKRLGIFYPAQLRNYAEKSRVRKFERIEPVRMFLARCATASYICALYILVPILPIFTTLVFGKRAFVLEYRHTLRKALVHISALRKGPALHFFHDILGRIHKVPEEIQGQCVQCGNCCMSKQCIFLEKIDDKKFQCGIYYSPLRKLSNCGSFPINKHDIERYECPSYFVPAHRVQTIRWMPNVVAGELPVTLKS
jgi:hypothetical protein